MDIKQALDILGLVPDASLEDAKISFRTLAKKHHPDKLKVNNTKHTANEKMQEINLAFHTLKKILKPEKISETKQKQPSKTTREKKAYSFQSLKVLLKKIHKTYLKTAKANIKQEKSSYSKTPKQTVNARRFVKRNKAFDTVLNKTIKSSLNTNSDPINKKSKIKSKNNYSTYMELKQKMRSKRKYMHYEGFTPIEKISPISPIKKT